MSTVTLTILIIAGYLGISIAIGAWVSKRYQMATVADIFTASKSLGIVALSMAIFGSQISAFGILGGPGLAYQHGYSSLSYLVGSLIGAPVGFFIVGYRTWVLNRNRNYVTSVQFFGDRFDSHTSHYIVAILQIILLIPYVVICGIGAGNILATVTEGAIPYWVGALLILVISSWTALTGGMRATAYTNVFQGLLIFAAMFLMVFFTYRGVGGAEALAELPHQMMSLDGSGIQNWKQGVFYSFLATGISNGVYAHMLVRNMSAKSPKTIKQNILLYPLLIGLFWLMSVILGVWGSIAIPGLTGAATENVVPMLAQKLAPRWMVGVLGAGILAAIMTSWDGQILAMSSMFSEDFYKPIFCKNRKLEEKEAKRISTAFIVGVSVIVYVLVLLKPASIISISSFSFAGTATLVPAYVGCLYWKKATNAGVTCSAIVGPLLCALWAFNILPASTTLGFFYGLPAFLAAIVVLVVVSKLTQQPAQKTVDNFFEPFGE